jgi:hypothetical protein
MRSLLSVATSSRVLVARSPESSVLHCENNRAKQDLKRILYVSTVLVQQVIHSSESVIMRIYFCFAFQDLYEEAHSQFVT